VLGLAFLFAFSPSGADAKSKKPKEVPHGTPVLWRIPADISSRNLYLGPGGARMRPDVRRIKFIKEEKGGYSKKFRIRDAAGREWVAKVGKEAQSETAAVRLLWAVGYETEINYLVPRLTIPGKGEFENVRLEARPNSEKRLDEWKWKENPFVGRREFQGLKVMMLLLSNWDIKDTNNKIIAVKDTNKLRYIISDLGATFGKTGSLPFFWRITRSRNNPEDYEEASFVEGVDDNYVDFHYGGKNRQIFDDITVAQAKWMGNWLSRLSRAQIRDAFRAANYTPDEESILTDAVLDRIDQLVRVASIHRAARR
jgi:ribosomal protein S24E